MAGRAGVQHGKDLRAKSHSRRRSRVSYERRILSFIIHDAMLAARCGRWTSKHPPRYRSTARITSIPRRSRSFRPAEMHGRGSLSRFSGVIASSDRTARPRGIVSPRNRAIFSARFDKSRRDEEGARNCVFPALRTRLIAI